MAIIRSSVWGCALYDNMFWLSLHCLGSLSKCMHTESFQPTRSPCSSLKTPHWDKTKPSVSHSNRVPSSPLSSDPARHCMWAVISIFWYHFPGRLISSLWGGCSFSRHCIFMQKIDDTHCSSPEGQKWKENGIRINTTTVLYHLKSITSLEKQRMINIRMYYGMCVSGGANGWWTKSSRSTHPSACTAFYNLERFRVKIQQWPRSPAPISWSGWWLPPLPGRILPGPLK